MDIKKYLTNKDVELSNEDINFEKLEKDIRKGYVLSEEVDKVKQETEKEYGSKYTELESKYNSLEKSYNDSQEKSVSQNNIISDLNLKVEMVSQGFDKEQFEEVAKLRKTLYADEEDDAKAISSLKGKFGSVYIPEKEDKQKPNIPNESQFNKPTAPPKDEIKVTRKTSIKDLIKK